MTAKEAIARAKEKGYTVHQLSKESGISPRTLFRWKKGGRPASLVLRDLLISVVEILPRKEKKRNEKNAHV